MIRTQLVEVEFELSELDNDSLISELLYRLNHNILSKKQIKEIEDYIPNRLPSISLEDKMKLDFLKENWDKFTSFDLDKLLK